MKAVVAVLWSGTPQWVSCLCHPLCMQSYTGKPYVVQSLSTEMPEKPDLLLKITVFYDHISWTWFIFDRLSINLTQAPGSLLSRAVLFELQHPPSSKFRLRSTHSDCLLVPVVQNQDDQHRLFRKRWWRGVLLSSFKPQDWPSCKNDRVLRSSAGIWIRRSGGFKLHQS